MDKRSDSSSPRKSDSKKSYKKDASRGAGGSENKPFKKPATRNSGDRPAWAPKSGEDRKPGGQDRPERSYGKRSGDEGAGEKRPYRKAEGERSGYAGKKPYEKKPYSDRSDKPAGDRKKTWEKQDGDERSGRKVFEKNKPWAKQASEEAAKRPVKRAGKFPERREDGEEGTNERPTRSSSDRPIKKYTDERKGRGDRKPYEKRGVGRPFDKTEEAPEKRKKPLDKEEIKKTYRNPNKKVSEDEAEDAAPEVKPRRRREEDKPIEGPMTLNKYIAHSGECSRRDAAAFVKEGKVRVNGELVVDPGYRVVPGDQVTLLGKKLTPQTNLVYVLLNKPKGFITTTEDPEERKTVMDLVANAGSERLYPIGRLDRNTTGVLLLTNDGTLAHKLSHPSYNIKKVYQVTLDKNLSRADYEKISKGVMLEDGLAQVDEIAYLENRNEVGLEIHSGKNRIVRRIFESLGYVVEKLDRVMYAGLTKKNVSRGKWRFLTEREVVLLKHFKN